MDHHCFLLSQPGAAAACCCSAAFNVTQQVNNQGTRMRTTLVAVDRRTGCIVYDKNDVGPIGPMGLMALDDRRRPRCDKTVRIRANTPRISFWNFTDKPVTAAVRKSSGAKKGPSNLGDALLNAVADAGLPELPSLKAMENGLPASTRRGWAECNEDEKIEFNSGGTRCATACTLLRLHLSRRL